MFTYSRISLGQEATKANVAGQDDAAAKALDCHLIVWSMSESVLRCVNIEETPFKEM